MKKLFVFLIILPVLAVMNNSCNWGISTLVVVQRFLITNKTTKYLKIIFKRYSINLKTETTPEEHTLFFYIDETTSLSDFTSQLPREKAYRYPSEEIQYIYLYDENDNMLYSQNPVDNSGWIKEIQTRYTKETNEKYTYVGFTLTITDNDLK